MPQCTKCGSWETGYRRNWFPGRLECWCKDCGHNWTIRDDEIDTVFIPGKPKNN